MSFLTFLLFAFIFYLSGVVAAALLAAAYNRAFPANKFQTALLLVSWVSFILILVAFICDGGPKIYFVKRIIDWIENR